MADDNKDKQPLFPSGTHCAQFSFEPEESIDLGTPEGAQLLEWKKESEDHPSGGRGAI